MLPSDKRAINGEQAPRVRRAAVEHREAMPPLRARERDRYSPAKSDRLMGLAGTVGIYAVLLLAFFVTINRVVPVKTQAPSLTMFDVAPPASPPDAPPEEREAPKPVEERKEPPLPSEVRPIEQSRVPISPVTVPVPVTAPKVVAPGTIEPETVAPRTAPAPPAPRVASNSPDTWEGRVLTALNKVRQYPRMAMLRRRQGVPYIRFVIDRDGKVLASRIERSSSFVELDREAIALPRRASPLPKPPDDKPGQTIELVVPVEFFIR